MNQQQRLTLFQRFEQQNPDPKTELQFTTTFELLVAVMLSAQSTDKRVNKVTAVLFAEANTPEALLTLGEEKTRDIIRSVNYYRTKAKHLIQTCHILMDQHQSQVPNNRQALEALPGVGRKTANVVLNTAFQEPTVAVDTHIFRVANRTGLAKGKTPLAVEQQLLKKVDPNYLHRAHHWLVLHGRYVCTARNPHCKTCLIQDLCDYTSLRALAKQSRTEPH